MRLHCPRSKSGAGAAFKKNLNNTIWATYNNFH